MSRFPQMRTALSGVDTRMMPPEEGKRLRARAHRRGGLYKLSAPQPGGRGLDSYKAEAAYVGYHKTFADRLNGMQADHIYPRIAQVVETDDLLDVQVWLTRNPKMRRWEGDKVLSKYRVESHPVRTAPHEASVEVPKKDIKNDRLGLYKPRIQSLADSYGLALDELAITMIAAGIAGTALGTTYDGQNLVDTDHTVLSVGGTAQSNKVTGALSAATLATARRRFLEFMDENGQPVNTAGKRMTLVVGPANEDIALDILVAKTLANGAQNVDAGSMELVVTPWLTGRTVVINGVSVTITGTEWFIIPEGSSAVIIQVKEGPEFLSVEDGPLAFIQGTYLYGIEAEFGAAYGLWQEIVGGPGV